MPTDVPYLTAAAFRDQVKGEFSAADSVVNDDRLTELIEEFEDVAERYRGVAFTPRSATVSMHPRCRRPWRLGHIEVTAITTVTIDGTAVADPAAGELIRHQLGWLLVPSVSWPSPQTSLTIAYTHGLAQVPVAVLRACRLYVSREAWAEANPTDGNTYSTTNADLGITVRESTADWARGRPTGWLDVDRQLNKVPDRRPRGMA